MKQEARQHDARQYNALAVEFEIEMSDPHRAELVQELRADQAFRFEYARNAFSLAANAPASSEDRAIGFAKLRTVAQACGGMAIVAERAKLKREQLYHVLSGKSNPTMTVLNNVLHAMGLRLTLAEDDDVGAKQIADIVDTFEKEILRNESDQHAASANEMASA